MKPFRQRKENPKALGYGNGWCAEMDRAWENGKYAVLARDIDTTMGKITHAFIRELLNRDIPWRDKQEIKNLIFGKESLAIEVFPPESDLVDAIGAYHLWVQHDLKDYPFNLKRG